MAAAAAVQIELQHSESGTPTAAGKNLKSSRFWIKHHWLIAHRRSSSYQRHCYSVGS